MKINKEILLAHYKKHLGRNFKMYGLETVLSINKVMRYYNPTVEDFRPYANRVIHNFIKHQYAIESDKLGQTNMVPYREYMSDEDSLIASECAEALRALKHDLINALDRDHYEVLYLSRVVGLSVQETAKILLLRVGTVRGALCRAEQFVERYKEQ